MTHFLVASWLTAIGLLAVAPAHRWLSPVGMAALAPATGIAIYVVVGTWLAAFGFFTALASLTVSTVIAVSLASLHVRLWGAKPVARDVLVAGALAFGLVATVSLVAVNVHATRLTTDSYRYLIAASQLEFTHGIESMDFVAAFKRMAAVPVLQASGWLTSDGYTPVVAPLSGAAALLTLVWLSIRTLNAKQLERRWVLVLVGSGLFLLVTTNRVVFNFTYIHSHMLFALLLLTAIGLSWLALVEGEHRFLYLVGVALAALAVTRPEAMMVIAIFLVPILSDRRLQIYDRLVMTVPVAVTAVIWYGFALLPKAADLEVSSGPPLGNAFLGLILVVFATMAGLPRLRRVTRLSPWLMLGGLALLLGFYAASDPALLADTISATAQNVASKGLWGAFWYVVGPLVIATMALGRVDSDRLLNFGFVGFFLSLPLMAYFRESAFRVGTGDSGNRMLMHVVPLVLFYLIVAAGNAASDIAFEREDLPSAVDGSV